MELSDKSVIQTSWAHHPLWHTRIILQRPMNKTNNSFPTLTASHTIVIKKDIRFFSSKVQFIWLTYTLNWMFFVCSHQTPSKHLYFCKYYTQKKKKDTRKKQLNLLSYGALCICVICHKAIIKHTQSLCSSFLHKIHLFVFGKLTVKFKLHNLLLFGRCYK